MANKNDYISSRRVYLDKSGNVVEANDPGKLTLLVAAGGSLSREDAERYGLLKGQPAQASQSEDAPLGASDGFGEDFPAYAALNEAGYTKRSELAALSDDDLTAIKGIGPATAEKIRAALKGE
jgi:DNA uptake protein ComE-like DNA-binding protein